MLNVKEEKPVSVSGRACVCLSWCPPDDEVAGWRRCNEPSANDDEPPAFPPTQSPQRTREERLAGIDLFACFVNAGCDGRKRICCT